MVKLWQCVVLSSVLALTACGTVKRKIDPNKTSWVIMSGYQQRSDLEKGWLGRTLTGNDNPTPRMVYLQSRAIFEKLDDKDERLDLLIFAASGNDRYTTVNAAPGTYRLTSFTLGRVLVNHDSSQCGTVLLTVKPNEVVYIGSLKPPPGIDIVGETYNKILPYFKADTIPNRDYLISRFDGEELASVLKKSLVTRVPQNNIPNPPASCIERPSWKKWF